MMNVQFFPSRRIAWYMARVFIVRSLAVLTALIAILMTLDLLGTSGEILAHPANDQSDLWRYVGLRIPQLVQRFLPFSVLLGTLITLATMNQNSEVIAMKAAGISAHQIIAPLILASLFVAAVNFVFNERIATRATASLNAWEAVEFGPVPPDAGVKADVWVKHGDDLIFARRVHGEGADARLEQVTVYDRTGGTLRRILEADAGRYAGNGWLLSDGSLFDVASGEVTAVPSVRIGAGITPDRFTLARVDPNEQGFSDLQALIDQLEAAGRETRTLEANLWHKLAGPLSAVLMPLLGAIAAFGLARSGHLFLRAVIGMALGFAYFVADNFALAMGNLGAYPPPLAAWGPFLLFLLIGEAVLIRTEE